jgi:hypothetical protein
MSNATMVNKVVVTAIWLSPAINYTPIIKYTAYSHDLLCRPEFGHLWEVVNNLISGESAPRFTKHIGR